VQGLIFLIGIFALRTKGELKRIALQRQGDGFKKHPRRQEAADLGSFQGNPCFNKHKKSSQISKMDIIFSTRPYQDS